MRIIKGDETMPDSLEKEFEWYLANQEKLVKKYDGRFIAIKNHEVIGDFEDFDKALDETLKTEKKGTFIVQKCSSGDEDYTLTFHSRVA